MINIPKQQSVVILRDEGSVDLATLNTKIAVAFETSHATALLNAFLMKRVRAEIVLQDAVAQEGPILVGMARGKATIAEIKAAVEMLQLDRSRQQQADVRVVLFETVRAMFDSNSGSGRVVWTIDESLGGGKGIPFDEGEGWQWFAYNADASNLTGNAFIKLQATYFGAWLGN